MSNNKKQEQNKSANSDFTEHLRLNNLLQGKLLSYLSSIPTVLGAQQYGLANASNSCAPSACTEVALAPAGKTAPAYLPTRDARKRTAGGASRERTISSSSSESDTRDDDYAGMGPAFDSYPTDSCGGTASDCGGGDDTGAGFNLLGSNFGRSATGGARRRRPHHRWAPYRPLRAKNTRSLHIHPFNDFSGSFHRYPRQTVPQVVMPSALFHEPTWDMLLRGRPDAIPKMLFGHMSNLPRPNLSAQEQARMHLAWNRDKRRRSAPPHLPGWNPVQPYIGTHDVGSLYVHISPAEHPPIHLNELPLAQLIRMQRLDPWNTMLYEPFITRAKYRASAQKAIEYKQGSNATVVDMGTAGTTLARPGVPPAAPVAHLPGAPPGLSQAAQAAAMRAPSGAPPSYMPPFNNSRRAAAIVDQTPIGGIPNRPQKPSTASVFQSAARRGTYGKQLEQASNPAQNPDAPPLAPMPPPQMPPLAHQGTRSRPEDGFRTPLQTPADAQQNNPPEPPPVVMPNDGANNEEEQLTLANFSDVLVNNPELIKPQAMRPPPTDPTHGNPVNPPPPSIPAQLPAEVDQQRRQDDHTALAQEAQTLQEEQQQQPESMEEMEQQNTPQPTDENNNAGQREIIEHLMDQVRALHYRTEQERDLFQHRTLQAETGIQNLLRQLDVRDRMLVDMAASLQAMHKAASDTSGAEHMDVEEAVQQVRAEIETLTRRDAEAMEAIEEDIAKMNGDEETDELLGRLQALRAEPMEAETSTTAHDDYGEQLRRRAREEQAAVPMREDTPHLPSIPSTPFPREEESPLQEEPQAPQVQPSPEPMPLTEYEEPSAPAIETITSQPTIEEPPEAIERIVDTIQTALETTNEADRELALMLEQTNEPQEVAAIELAREQNAQDAGVLAQITTRPESATPEQIAQALLTSEKVLINEGETAEEEEELPEFWDIPEAEEDFAARTPTPADVYTDADAPEMPPAEEIKPENKREGIFARLKSKANREALRKTLEQFKRKRAPASEEGDENPEDNMTLANIRDMLSRAVTKTKEAVSSVMPTREEAVVSPLPEKMRAMSPPIETVIEQPSQERALSPRPAKIRAQQDAGPSEPGSLTSETFSSFEVLPPPVARESAHAPNISAPPGAAVDAVKVPEPELPVPETYEQRAERAREEVKRAFAQTTSKRILKKAITIATRPPPMQLRQMLDESGTRSLAEYEQLMNTRRAIRSLNMSARAAPDDASAQESMQMLRNNRQATNLSMNPFADADAKRVSSLNQVQQQRALSSLVQSQLPATSSLALPASTDSSFANLGPTSQLQSLAPASVPIPEDQGALEYSIEEPVAYRTRSRMRQKANEEQLNLPSVPNEPVGAQRARERKQVPADGSGYSARFNTRASNRLSGWGSAAFGDRSQPGVRSSLGAQHAYQAVGHTDPARIITVFNTPNALPAGSTHRFMATTGLRPMPGRTSLIPPEAPAVRNINLNQHFASAVPGTALGGEDSGDEGVSFDEPAPLFGGALTRPEGGAIDDEDEFTPPRLILATNPISANARRGDHMGATAAHYRGPLTQSLLSEARKTHMEAARRAFNSAAERFANENGGLPNDAKYATMLGELGARNQYGTNIWDSERDENTNMNLHMSRLNELQSQTNRVIADLKEVQRELRQRSNEGGLNNEHALRLVTRDIEQILQARMYVINMMEKLHKAHRESLSLKPEGVHRGPHSLLGGALPLDHTMLDNPPLEKSSTGRLLDAIAGSERRLNEYYQQANSAMGGFSDSEASGLDRHKETLREMASIVNEMVSAQLASRRQRPITGSTTGSTVKPTGGTLNEQRVQANSGAIMRNIQQFRVPRGETTVQQPSLVGMRPPNGDWQFQWNSTGILPFMNRRQFPAYSGKRTIFNIRDTTDTFMNNLNQNGLMAPISDAFSRLRRPPDSFMEPIMPEDFGATVPATGGAVRKYFTDPLALTHHLTSRLAREARDSGVALDDIRMKRIGRQMTMNPALESLNEPLDQQALTNYQRHMTLANANRTASQLRRDQLLSRLTDIAKTIDFDRRNFPNSSTQLVARAQPILSRQFQTLSASDNHAPDALDRMHDETEQLANHVRKAMGGRPASHEVQLSDLHDGTLNSLVRVLSKDGWYKSGGSAYGQEISDPASFALQSKLDFSPDISRPQAHFYRRAIPLLSRFHSNLSHLSHLKGSRLVGSLISHSQNKFHTREHASAVPPLLNKLSEEYTEALPSHPILLAKQPYEARRSHALSNMHNLLSQLGNQYGFVNS